MRQDNHRIWVIGATGLVGRAILDILLTEWKLPPQKIECVASPKRAGERFSHAGHEFHLSAPQPTLFNASEHHFVVLATDTEISRQWVQFIAHTPEDSPTLHQKIPSHITVIDSSSAYRLAPEVPLVIPEINGTLLQSNPRLIASPNCTTIGFLVGITPFWKHLSVKRIFLSSYQSASGAGYGALKALEADLSTGSQTTADYFPFPLAQDCIPQIGAFNDTGFSAEEMKVLNETHKIFETSIPLHITCARIPVSIGHSEAVSLELQEPLSHQQLEHIVAQDKKSAQRARVFASPSYGAVSLKNAVGSSRVHISRLRIHPTDPHYLHLWIQFDNIRVGAATNLCRILSAMLK